MYYRKHPFTYKSPDYLAKKKLLEDAGHTVTLNEDKKWIQIDVSTWDKFSDVYYICYNSRFKSKRDLEEERENYEEDFD